MRFDFWRAMDAIILVTIFAIAAVILVAGVTIAGALVMESASAALRESRIVSCRELEPLVSPEQVEECVQRVLEPCKEE